MSVVNEIELELDKYINRTMYHPEWGIYFIKELVARVRNMKIEIYSNDHNPPHFHVKSNDKSIDAVFRLDNGEYLRGIIGNKDQKRIEAFFKDVHVKELMRKIWNKSKGGRQKLQ